MTGTLVNLLGSSHDAQSAESLADSHPKAGRASHLVFELPHQSIESDSLTKPQASPSHGPTHAASAVETGDAAEAINLPLLTRTDANAKETSAAADAKARVEKSKLGPAGKDGTAGHVWSLPMPSIPMRQLAALPGDVASKASAKEHAGHRADAVTSNPSTRDSSRAHSQTPAAKNEPAEKPTPPPAAELRDTSTPSAQQTAGLAAKPAAQVPAMAAPAVAQLAPLLPPQMVADPDWRLTMLARSAHMAVDTGNGESLSVHLQIRNGVTDVKVVGPAAAMMAGGENSLRLALVQQGLTLGQLNTSTQDQQRSSSEKSEKPEDREERMQRTASRSTSDRATSLDSASDLSSSVATHASNRLHVKA